MTRRPRSLAVAVSLSTLALAAGACSSSPDAAKPAAPGAGASAAAPVTPATPADGADAGASASGDDDATPPDLGSVSTATVCLSNGTIHDPNPVGCNFSGDCMYAPRTDGGEWDHGRWKFQCDANSWLEGVSIRASDLHASGFWCGMRPDMTTTVSGAQNVAGGTYGQSGSGDWDPGFVKAECPASQYVSGFSVNTNNGTVGNIRCVQTANESPNTSCHGVTFTPHYPPWGDVGFVDGTYDWSPHAFKLQCNPGEHVAGVSTSNGDIHGILCCAGGPPATTSSTGSTACCNTTAYNSAVTSCLADPAKNATSCNLVDYCCQPGVSSFAGSTSCSQVDLAQDPNTEGGTGITVTPGSSSAPSAANGAWSLVGRKSSVRGNSQFGAGYDASLSLSANKSTLQATGKAEVLGYAILFGRKLQVADIEADGALSTQTVHADANVVGIDLWTYSQSATPSYAFNKSWTYTFFEMSKTFTVGPVPVTVAGSVEGSLGIGGTLAFASGQLSAGGAPHIDVTANASAALGGGYGPFSLDAGVEGSLTLFEVDETNTATVTPGLQNVAYATSSNLTVQELNGSVDLFVEGTLKLVFARYHKKWTHQIVSFSGPKQTVSFLSYSGTMAY